MKVTIPTINWAGNYEENCERLAKHLGTSKIRRKLFNTIYGRVSQPRSRKQLLVASGLKATDGQQAQNELDHLCRNGLIHRIENEGHVGDRSRYLYCKDSNVRAHRHTIVKYANKPALANNVPTMRRPVGKEKVTVIKMITRSALKKRKKLDVLYSTANPNAESPIRVDAEMRQVQEAVRGSKLRDNIELHYRPAVNLKSILDGLNDLAPGIVHFSGHGNRSGISVDHAKVKPPSGKMVSFDLLAKAIQAVDSPPQVVVLNACQSAGAKNAFLPPARALIVMGDSISDLAATAFAARFYAAIASGQSLQAAFDQGVVAVAAVSLTEEKTPQLLVANGVNPRKLVLT